MDANVGLLAEHLHGNLANARSPWLVHQVTVFGHA